ncbi:Hypothetical protein NTJ_03084 [Nesidiocoris tenuis]|uniref:MD-2-related lipid-recognition domain-containing protein n=1 Tax=Nesidiocoris tenuis TaxID=355587 RepID=A0ABN7ADC2_9HEMI|nr:Hypothetical protein NTJ_03084 [Nesidiocoris tenuis]
MNTVLVTGVLFYAVALGFAACPFKVKVTRVARCKSNVNSIFEVPEHPIVAFTDTCEVTVDGCVHYKDEVKSMNLSIKALKNGIPVLRTTARACGFKSGKFVVNCPVPKDSDMCAGKERFKVPGGSAVIQFLVGRIGGTVDVITDKGVFCYEAEGVVSRA